MRSIILAIWALSTAVKMYRAMDMTLWLPQAETAPAQIGEVLFDRLEVHRAANFRPRRTKTGQFKTDAAILQKLGRHDDAIADYNTMLEINPGSHNFLNGRAKAVWLKGDAAAALADAEIAVKAARGASLYRYTLANILASLGRQDEAMKEFEPCKFTCIDDPLYAGADGALELATDMPEEFLEQL